jgi:bZIP transcription factor
MQRAPPGWGSTDDIMRLWASQDGGTAAVDASLADEDMQQALQAAIYMEASQQVASGARIQGEASQEVPNLAAPIAHHAWPAWQPPGPSAPVWGSSPAMARLSSSPRGDGVAFSPSFSGQARSMSTMTPNELAAMHARLTAQAEMNAQLTSQAAAGGVSTSPQPQSQPAEKTLVSRLMLDLRPIVAANTGANALALQTAKATALEAAQAPAQMAATVAHDLPSPSRARVASAKAVAAAETAQLLGELNTAPPALTAAGPELAEPPKKRMNGGGSTKRPRSISGGAGGPGTTGSDSGDEEEGTDDGADGEAAAAAEGSPKDVHERRVLSNRESARRSRKRKLERMQALEGERDAAKAECALLRGALVAAGLPLPAGVGEVVGGGHMDMSLPSMPAPPPPQVAAVPSAVPTPEHPPAVAVAAAAQAPRACPSAVKAAPPPSKRLTRASQAAGPVKPRARETRHSARLGK